MVEPTLAWKVEAAIFSVYPVVEKVFPFYVKTQTDSVSAAGWGTLAPADDSVQNMSHFYRITQLLQNPLNFKLSKFHIRRTGMQFCSTSCDLLLVERANAYLSRSVAFDLY